METALLSCPPSSRKNCDLAVRATCETKLPRRHYVASWKMYITFACYLEAEEKFLENIFPPFSRTPELSFIQHNEIRKKSSTKTIQKCIKLYREFVSLIFEEETFRTLTRRKNINYQYSHDHRYIYIYIIFNERTKRSHESEEE